MSINQSMTPKEKAEELVDRFYTTVSEISNNPKGLDKAKAADCALLAVDEIDRHIVRSTPKNDPYCNLTALEYWQEVKSEINKL